MSLYNALFGENPSADRLLEMLSLSRESFGRYRDIYLTVSDEIIVYTRIGGNYREHYREVFEALKNHPYAIRDYEDRDETYCYFVFMVPPKFREECDDMLEAMEPPRKPASISEKFEKLNRDMTAGVDTPEVQRQMAIGKRLLDRVAETGRPVIGLFDADMPGASEEDHILV